MHSSIFTVKSRRLFVAMAGLCACALAFICVLSLTTPSTTLEAKAEHRDASSPQGNVKTSRMYEIKTTWDDNPVDHEPVVLNFEGSGENLILTVKAPFFNRPPNPGGPAGEPFWELWNYEVVEAFFADGNETQPKYVEIELCPWGQHLILFLDGVHNAIKHSLPLNFTANITGNTWEGSAQIPASYFPPQVTRFNAYAIHDDDSGRRYESLFPVPTGKYPNADFHRLEYFQPIDFASLIPSNASPDLPSDWQDALNPKEA